MRLHVDHYGGTDDGRTHAPVPFFVSSRGYGALINSARYIDVWCGTSVRKDSKNPPVVRDRNTDKQWAAQPYSDNLEFLVPAEGVEIVLFGGQQCWMLYVVSICIMEEEHCLRSGVWAFGIVSLHCFQIKK